MQKLLHVYKKYCVAYDNAFCFLINKKSRILWGRGQLVDILLSLFPKWTTGYCRLNSDSDQSTVVPSRRSLRWLDGYRYYPTFLEAQLG